MSKNTHIPSVVSSLGAALFDHGLRVREDFDELILNQRDFQLRIHVAEKNGGSDLRCFVSVLEDRLTPGLLVLFNEIALDGYPVVAFGAGRGQVTFEFKWFHPAGADWRISAERCQGLVDRVVGTLIPRCAPKRSSLSLRYRALSKRAVPLRRLAPIGNN